MTRIAVTALLALGVAFANTGASADGDAMAGKTKAVVCAACHGPDGNSTNPDWPSLAGQHEGYLMDQLAAFKSGARKNVLMSPMAVALTDQDRADLAAYYNSQPVKGGEADPALVEAGQRVFRGGTAVSACAACHGPNGHGNPGAKMPRIAGQSAAYTAAQLRLYASGERRTDLNQMMRNVAAALSAEEITAVASYIQGLR